MLVNFPMIRGSFGDPKVPNFGFGNPIYSFFLNVSKQEKVESFCTHQPILLKFFFTKFVCMRIFLLGIIEVYKYQLDGRVCLFFDYFVWGGRRVQKRENFFFWKAHIYLEYVLICIGQFQLCVFEISMDIANLILTSSS